MSCRGNNLARYDWTGFNPNKDIRWPVARLASRYKITD